MEERYIHKTNKTNKQTKITQPNPTQTNPFMSVRMSSRVFSSSRALRAPPHQLGWELRNSAHVAGLYHFFSLRSLIGDVLVFYGLRSTYINYVQTYGLRSTGRKTPPCIIRIHPHSW